MGRLTNFIYISITYEDNLMAKTKTTVEHEDTNVVDIYDVRDSNGNKWYEVPYLAQELVYTDYANIESNDKDLDNSTKSNHRHFRRII